MREGLVLMAMLWSVSCAHAPHVEPAVQAHLCKQFALEPFHTPPADAVPERDDEIMLRASRGWGKDAVYHVG